MTNDNLMSELLEVEARKDDARKAGLAGSPLSAGAMAMNSAKNNTFVFTHFTERTIPGTLTLTEEGTTTAAATYGTGLGGVATITSDDVAAKTDQLTTGLMWQCDRQVAGNPIVAEVRWKTGATITSSEYWIGITDAAPDTDPIALSTTSTFTTSVPTDGVYMGYSATPTSGGAFTTGGNLHTAISIKADTNTLVGTGGGVFVAATYYTYRFELDYNGTCRYYLNGTLLFTQASALTTTVPLCLMVCAAPRTTASAVIAVDFMGIRGA